MKGIKFISILVITILITANLGIATEFHAKQPILITAAGQGPDVTMVKILCQKAGLKFTFDKLAKPDQLKNHATLILVTGASSKGLGAANIDKDQEFSRVQSLIKSAQQAKMTIITMHIGGPSRRGKLSDDFNKITTENTHCLIIEKSGNKDKFFSKIATEKKIPVYLIDKKLDAIDILKQIFTEKK